MNNSCRKTFRNSSKRWVPLATLRGIPGRRPLRQPNANLYHYAGNNPVRYSDSDGKFSFDVEAGIIYCDLNNSEDVALASTQFVMYEDRGFPVCIAKDSNSGVYIKFYDSETMVNFVAENCYDRDYGSKIENFVDNLGSLTTLADVASIPNMSNISTGLGVASTLIDIDKAINNPTASNIIDVGIDTAGLIGGLLGSATVPLLSIYLSCTKFEIEWWIQTMSEGTVEFNNWMKQYEYERMMEEMENY